MRHSVICKRTGQSIASKLDGGTCTCKPGECKIGEALPPTIGHNSQKRIVELDEELLAFALLNCDVNLRVGLHTLNGIASRDLAEQMVANIENFKKLKAALERAK